MVRRAPRVTVLLGLVVALVLAGCGGDPASTGPESPTGAATGVAEPQDSSKVADPGLVAYSRLLDRQGRLTPDAALRVYATVVGPLPGVRPVALGEEPGRFLGPALRVLGRDLEALAPGQRTAVSATIASVAGSARAPMEPVEVDIVVDTAAGAGETAPRIVVPADVPSAGELAPRVEEMRARFEERSGHDLRLPIRVRVVPTTPRNAAITNAYPVDSAPTHCGITLPHLLFEGFGDLTVNSTIAHEVWHCFQFDVSPDSLPAAWIHEGQAEWAGEEYVGGSPSSAGRWDTWLTTGSASLFRRSYDAIGIYAVAAQSGADPWQSMLGMLEQSGVAAAETLFGIEPQVGLKLTAEALTREPGLGANWESSGPGITAAENSPTLSVTEGAPDGIEVAAGAFGTMSADLRVEEGDVIVLETSGGDVASVELPGVETMQVPGAGTLTLCLKDGGCACPDGSNPGGGDALPQAGAGVGALSIGTLTGTQLQLRGHLESLEEACEEDQLAGRWYIPVEQVWQQFRRVYGGGGGPMTCDGDYYLTLGDDARFDIQYSSTCRLLGRSGRGRATITGGYTVGEGTLAFADVRATGTFTMNGVTQPLPGLDGLRRSMAGTARYELEGDRLDVHFPVSTGATVDLRYTRVE